ncbi:hypothetical protein CB0940_11806 [Cercospora beticola]|uniref:Tat pathway signal sequence n=1 Tax=Cercospora beticola TaxID=122368 RepID=A0A2G5IFC0_CERBT|nr:hypothetical protein CB0940_11806 [Cercospora beticola]PIB03163.1 hypothetical protein CB0940_11806 [Cercospora beticola]WPB04166.1 hypothetical protein RHO25_008811 [Cercospora beticola]CAK1357033.1 unnamed protein product [Cercospora beticola]
MNRSRPGSASNSRPSSSRQSEVNSIMATAAPKPPIPRKSALRQSASEQSLHALPYPLSPVTNVHAHKDSYETGRTAPPAYEWVPEPVAGDSDDNRPVEGEKLAALRRSGGYQRKNPFSWRRRTWLIIAGVALLAIALIVGLAVGLTVGRSGSNSNNGAAQNTSDPTSSGGADQQPFPIGQYSMITRLQTLNSSCTSVAETWNCFPYQVYDPANAATSDGSRSIYNWVISNTSSTYATIGSGSTSDDGEPANLTISSTSNPFSLMFEDTPLTYISPKSNSSSARYTFRIDMDKAFNPPVSLAANNVATQCYFNQTSLTGTLYLSAPRTYPESNNSDGGLQWPYAIDIRQSSPGGTDVPACYEFVQGQQGARITSGLTPQSVDTECSCDYRNY